jgi:hypothetical protein
MLALLPLRSPDYGGRKDRYNQRLGREGPTELVFPLVLFPALMTLSSLLRVDGKESGTDKMSQSLSPSLRFQAGTQNLVGIDDAGYMVHL